MAASWAETCGVCGNTLLWWRSKSGYRVCMICARDPMAALEVLARRASPAAVTRVQTWRQSVNHPEPQAGSAR